MTIRTISLLWLIGLVLSVGSVVRADGIRYDYSISFDNNGELSHGTWNSPHIFEEITTSGGDGDGWYYYKSSDRYIMWFHTGPYNDQQQAEMLFHLFVASALEDPTTDYEVTVGWTTPHWQDASSPPLPSDMSTTSLENLYLQTQSVVSVYGNPMSGDNTYEVSRNITVYDYNPEWICVCASGRNVWMWRFITHESSTSGDDPDDPPTVIWDFGDAPASYGVLARDNGARHALGSSLRLGQYVSGENDGRPHVNADLDNYDDGVVFTNSLQPGLDSTVLVTASGSGFVSAWLDQNRNGHWNDPGEQVISNAPVIAGQNSLPLPVSNNAQAGPSFARFRLSRTSGLSVSGPAPDGEVEDYAVTITTPAPVWDPNGPVNPQYTLTSLWEQSGAWKNPSETLLSGWGVESLWRTGPLVADDWNYSGAEPVVGLRWWGTFQNHTATQLPAQAPDAFHFGIWTHNGIDNAPGTLIWETTSSNWTWNLAGKVEDPITQQAQQSAFEFTCTLNQDQWFSLPITSDSRFWLSIAAVYDGVTSVQAPWAWLTRLPLNLQPANRINQISGIGGASFPPFILANVEGTQTITKPAHQSWDMTFELLTRKLK